MNKRTEFILITMWYLLMANTTFAFTRQDSLRGGNGPGRSWWDVTRYDLNIQFDTATRSISGYNQITMRVADNVNDSMQLDLQELMFLDSITWKGRKLEFAKEENVWWVTTPANFGTELETIAVYYHGRPREAKLPPWDGGFIWTQDSSGKPWISVACQGLGASSWWPCKDYQSDEPEHGMTINIELPKGLTCVSNGRELLETVGNAAGYNTLEGITTTWHWKVVNPINSYNVAFYIGDYINWQDTLIGEKGKLDLSFYALRENEQKARAQFAVVKPMLHCLEYWMGPYPFYEDGYKLVEAPFLGMEHQSAIAYGNEYKMGYRGSDRSATGIGLLFDFIIIHESGHEWFGNNITARDIADNWIHEGFTTYSEALFAECTLGKEKAYAYTRGEWKNIRNDKPVTGAYSVHDGGSGDKYDKGSALVHMIRMIINDDTKFREMLRGLNKEFYHKMVNSTQVEQYVSKYTSVDLKPIFDQYLRAKDIPVLEYFIKDKQLFYRFTGVTDGFTLVLEVWAGKKKAQITPTADWQHIEWKKGGYDVSFSRDFLFKLKS